MEQRLCRSETDRMIGGVCGGLAEYLAVDSVWVRLVAVLLVFADGVGLLAYIVLWIIMPTQSKIGLAPKEVAREGVEEMKETAREMGERARQLAQEARMSMGGGSAAEESAVKEARARHSYVVAAILIVVGLILILGNFGLLWWLHIGRLWPLLLIIAGVVLLLRRRE